MKNENKMIEELHGLVCRKQAEELAIAAKDNDLNQRTDTGDTLLLSAIRNDTAEIAKILLENGADPNYPNDRGWYPLHFAIQQQNMDIVKLLVKNGANINQQDGIFGNTPVFIAVAKTEGRAFIDFFLNLGADVTIPNKMGVTVLQVANRKNVDL
ncbi:hypothetical protein GCM10009118_24540 [Wandonia haliotis]|uniref:Ankyrin repeat domain-containing protein n=1 Tax=Wandonia haliotis TaxID=574963 RepID=A0ABN1MRS0_9FLAO